MGKKTQEIQAKVNAQDAETAVSPEKTATSGRRSWFPYSDVVAVCATKTGISTGQANKCLKTLFELTKTLVSRGEVVVYPGLMSIEGRIARATTGRNPKTGQTIDIPEHIYMGFKASPKVKELLKKQEVSTFTKSTEKIKTEQAKRREALVNNKVMPILDELGDLDVDEEL